MDVLRGPRHLARITLKGPHHVLAVAASPDGALVAVSDASCVRLYRVRLHTELWFRRQPAPQAYLRGPVQCRAGRHSDPSCVRLRRMPLCGSGDSMCSPQHALAAGASPDGPLIRGAWHVICAAAPGAPAEALAVAAPSPVGGCGLGWRLRQHSR